MTVTVTVTVTLTVTVTVTNTSLLQHIRPQKVWQCDSDEEEREQKVLWHWHLALVRVSIFGEKTGACHTRQFLLAGLWTGLTSGVGVVDDVTTTTSGGNDWSQCRIFGSGNKVIQLFFSSSPAFLTNKLERLHLATFFRLVYSWVRHGKVLHSGRLQPYPQMSDSW
jgi:hypothetical protein